MAQLSEAQVRSLLECVGALYRCGTLHEFRQAVIRGLPAVVAGQYASYNELDLKRGQAICLSEHEVDDVQRLAGLLIHFQHEHPLIQRFAQQGDGQALKISDLLSSAEYERTGLYNEVYATMNLRDQMSIGISIGGAGLLGVVTNRERRNFSEEDRLLMNLLRPHLEQAFHQAAAAGQLEALRAQQEDLLSAAGRAIVFLNRAGEPADLSPTARLWLRHFFGSPARGEALPPPVKAWLRLSGTTRSGRLSLPRRPLLVERDGERLQIRIVRGGTASATLLLERQVTRLDPARLTTLGLTVREAEVLYWVAQGKTNPEIGIILSISKRTVHKHLERVFVKLGVETRVAAAMRADETMRLINPE